MYIHINIRYAQIKIISSKCNILKLILKQVTTDITVNLEGMLNPSNFLIRAIKLQLKIQKRH